MELSLGMISNRKFNFSWADPIRKNEVQITLPDLDKLEHTVWGDWGPMHSFALSKKDPIIIKHNDQIIEGTQKRLNIDSPMLVHEREVFPYFFVIVDPVKKIKFKLYINKDHDLAKVEIIGTNRKLKLFEKSEQNFINAMI